MKILIITYEFPPLNTIGAQRPYSWAKYWSRMGHTVYVLTAQKQKFDGLIDTNFSFDAISDVAIEAVPYLLVSRSSTNRSVMSISHSSKVNSPSLIDWIKKVAKILRQRSGMGAVFSFRNLWVGPAVKHGVSLHQEHNFDFMVSTYGPPASHIVAKHLKSRFDIFWIADYRDLWSGTHYQDAQGFFAWFQKAEEGKTIAKANLLTTVSEPLCKALANRFDKPTFTIENGFDIEEIPEVPNSLTIADQVKVQLLYTGKVREGKQVIQPLFDALAHLRDQRADLTSKLEILFYGSELGEIPQLIEDYKMQNILKVMGLIPRPKALALQRQADGLLFFDWKDVNVDGILTGKIFEYIYAGTPILGIGSYVNRSAGQLIKESGCGVCLGQDVSEISQIIGDMISGEKIAYSPNKVILNQYSRENLALKMLKVITDHL